MLQADSAVSLQVAVLPHDPAFRVSLPFSQFFVASENWQIEKDVSTKKTPPSKCSTVCVLENE